MDTVEQKPNMKRENKSIFYLNADESNTRSLEITSLSAADSMFMISQRNNVSYSHAPGGKRVFTSQIFRVKLRT